MAGDDSLLYSLFQKDKTMNPETCHLHGIEKKIEQYIQLLWEENRKINLVSKKMTHDALCILIRESLILGKRIKANGVIDAGSGNGIVGIPLALTFPHREFILVEPTKKKAIFLNQTVKDMRMTNVIVKNLSIQEFMHGKQNPKAIVARGFPRLDILESYFLKGRINQLLAITSIGKLKKTGDPLEFKNRQIYNIPYRDNLILCVWDHVSRETIEHE